MFKIIKALTAEGRPHEVFARRLFGDVQYIKRTNSGKMRSKAL